VNQQLTLLLSCFSESFSHFMNSGDGATGVSSTLGAAGGPFAGGAAERRVEGTTPLDEATDPMDDDGVKVGRPAEDAATMAAVAFPLAPTVVHAPPTDGAVELAYIYRAVRASTHLTCMSLPCWWFQHMRDVVLWPQLIPWKPFSSASLLPPRYPA